MRKQGAHTLTHSHTHTLTLSHTHTLTLSHSHTLTLSHSRTLALTLTHPRSHSHPLTQIKRNLYKNKTRKADGKIRIKVENEK
jgi:hypothetical protein